MGNFLEQLLELLKEFDPYLLKYQSPENASYSPLNSLNGLTDSCDLKIDMDHETKRAVMFSVLDNGAWNDKES